MNLLVATIRFHVTDAQNEKKRASVVNLWGKLQFVFSKSRITIKGEQNIPTDGGCLFVANHRSYVDIFLVHASCSRVPRWVVKESLLRYPLLGWHLKRSGAVALDREESRSAAKTLLKVAADLKAGDSFIVFPEGTRSDSDHMLEFKGGVFALAQRAGVPLIPVVIRGTARVLPPRSLGVHCGQDVEIDYLSPMNPSDFGKNREALIKEVRKKMESVLYS